MVALRNPREGVSQMYKTLLPLIVLFTVVVSTAMAQDAPTKSPDQSAKVASESSVRPESSARQESSVKPGINKRFVDPQLDISEWLGRFEVESREVYAARERILDACQIKPGMTVSDVGAGTGFYSRLFASAVGPRGRVYAADISPRFVEYINDKSKQQDVRNITCVLCTDHSTRLPANSTDVVFICDTYHHFEFPKSTLASIHHAMKPGGTLVLIDFERIPGTSREWTIDHVRAGKEVFKNEITSAGFHLIEEVKIPSFKENYLLKFRKN